MSLGSKIRKSLEGNWVMRFTTNHPDGDSIDGVVTSLQRGYIALREDRDLQFDGIVVLPRRVITGYRDGEFERACNAVHRHVGDLDETGNPDWLASCLTLEGVVRELMARDVWPGVEVVFDGDDGKDCAFYVGPVVGVEPDGFRIHCFDAAGAWEDVYDIDFDEVFKITFEDSYTSRFVDYMRAKHPRV